MPSTTHDSSSAANAAHHETKHIDIDWTIDFKRRIIFGSVTLKVRVVDSTADKLLLDTRLLKVESVKVNGQTAVWQLIESPHKYMGSCLSINTLVGANELSVEIAYETTPDSTALQWLDAGQTADKRQPFFYSQCQAIHARSLLPCQDSPLIKSTFKACVLAPKEITVVMGGVRVGASPSSKVPDCMQYDYKQDVAIPSYLIAIAGGALASKSLGPRSTVWAEPSMVDKAAYEFALTDDMLRAAESLCGPYVWGVYDLLILPPSFPYGGMENPCLTFLTPAVLTGDRSLTSVVAHEISHSWTGNLVTNCNWDHFWLNEGHTVYLERLVGEKLDNTEMRHLRMSSGYDELIAEVKNLGATNPLTKLTVDVSGVDPDVAYSRVPYEKGSLLLYFLELKVGKENMLLWLKDYLHHFIHQSIDTPTWLAFFKQFMSGRGINLDDVDWDDWLKQPGMPKWKPKFEADAAFAQCSKLVTLFTAPKLAQDNSMQDEFVALWTKVFPVQRTLALTSILTECLPVASDNLTVVRNLIGMAKQTNPEIRLKWSVICAQSHFEPGLEDGIAFVNSTGRFKYIRPVYKAMYAWEHARPRVVANFKSQRTSMHSTTSMLLAGDLGEQ